jgi:16S rRNA (cytidine1402-2'-O)-methyltransferase
MAGKLYIVATPIGNLEDMTPRAIEALRKADLVVAEDTRNSLVLLNHFDIKTKIISYHKFNERKRTEEILSNLIREETVALVCDAGTPCISDPGYILVQSAAEQGVEVIGICGACAATTALSVSGFNSDTFMFNGFLPREKGASVKRLEELKAAPVNIIIFYESPKRIIKMLGLINEAYPDARVCLCNDLTKKYERIYRGSVLEVIEELQQNANHEKGEYALVVEKNFTFEARPQEEIGIEARLVDIMIKKNVSLREAVEELRLSCNGSYDRKSIYNASLALKQLFE